jgi:plastocyanin
MITQTIRRLTAVALVAACGALAACGSGDSTTASKQTTAAPAKTAAAAGGTRLALDAGEQGGLSFSKKALATKAGAVTIILSNPQGNHLPHAIALEGQGVQKAGQTVQAGGTSTVTADLKPGTYTYFCPVGDHRQEGMEGTLTVK